MIIARVDCVFTLFISTKFCNYDNFIKLELDIMTVTPTRIISFYINLIDEQIELLGNHLAEDVVLYWYGHTVEGKALVLCFLSEEIASPEHNITSVKAIPEIKYREISSTSNASIAKEDACLPVTCGSVGLPDSNFGPLSPAENTADQQLHESGLQPLESSLIHNTPDVKMSERQHTGLLHAPKKRKSVPSLCLSMSIGNGNTSFLEARGSISFHRVGRPYGYRRPWHRECTLQLAYSCPPLGGDPVSCCEFSVIIYSGDMKCRRNLAKDFEQLKIVGENFED